MRNVDVLRRQAIDRWAAAPPDMRASVFEAFCWDAIRVAGMATPFERLSLAISALSERVFGAGSEQSQDAPALMAAFPSYARALIVELLLCRRAMSPAFACYLLRDVWRSGDFSSLRLSLERRLAYFHEACIADSMSPDEAQMFASLDSRLKLFRGAKLIAGSLEKAALHLSWTGSIDLAASFAGFGCGDGPGVVMSMDVDKSSVLATFLELEPEFLIDPRPHLSSLRLESAVSASGGWQSAAAA